MITIFENKYTTTLF